MFFECTFDSGIQILCVYKLFLITTGTDIRIYAEFGSGAEIRRTDFQALFAICACAMLGGGIVVGGGVDNFHFSYLLRVLYLHIYCIITLHKKTMRAII